MFLLFSMSEAKTKSNQVILCLCQRSLNTAENLNSKSLNENRKHSTQCIEDKRIATKRDIIRFL